METIRLSGVIAHPTSLPGRFGIGDLGKCAYDFIDFLHSGKQRIWQVLPLNPTSFGDSPYQSFSTFAGNHLLISPELLIKDNLLFDKDLIEIPEFSNSIVEYGRVIEYKNSIFRKAYENFKNSGKSSLKKNFTSFNSKNSSWLDGYSLFIALKLHFIQERKNTWETPEYMAFAEKNKKFLTKNQIDDYYYGAIWSSWPQDIAQRKNSAVSKWMVGLNDEIEYQKFLQFLFFRQWAALKQYANSKNISILGDIPIFVALDSADVWCSRSLFLIDEENHPSSVAGVPPDYFSATGQLWGNPLYDWAKHKETDFKWWIERIEATLGIVDIIRIDHFRGFESFWSIKYGEETAVNGKWNKGPGKELFNAIKEKLGRLPIVAEDLGIITEKVEKLRDALGLPGMKVLQFGFDADKNNLNLPHNFKTQNIVVYTGTHDNDTTKGWYEKAAPEIQDHLRRYLNSSGEDASWGMIRLAFLSTAMFAIIPVQDILSLGSESRMNVPGVAENNWQFRFGEEDLEEGFAEKLAYLSELSDRNWL